MRYLKNQLFSYGESGDLRYVEIAGTATETKPSSGIVSGSRYIETDTGLEFVFDESSSNWTQIGGSTESGS